MTNALARSLSPYLLQHQENPVDWVEWGPDAFETACQRDVPLFLSVGYAACHWCHVMAHESFENKEVGAYLNEHFVCIKVDREERPDIDQIYMNAVQLMTGHGGWPMSVFLDHDGRPFYSGTYWPVLPRQGMPSFPQVLDALVDAWANRRDEIHSHAGEMTQALQELAVGTGSKSRNESGGKMSGLDRVGPDRVGVAVEGLLKSFDPTWGGFGSAPKFPHATDLSLLLRVGIRTSDTRLIHAAEFTLDRMAAGGIRDHIGGGFARYSVDGHWLVPHFEKMLYDNGLLVESVKLGETIVADFYDCDAGAFFYTANDSEKLITRNKDWHDGSLVSGNAAAAMLLLKLSRLTNHDWMDEVHRTLQAGQTVIREQSRACSALIAVLDDLHHHQGEWVVAVAEAADVASVATKVLAKYNPGTTVAWSVVQGSDSTVVAEELLKGKQCIDGEAVVYRCQDYRCESPEVITFR